MRASTATDFGSVAVRVPPAVAWSADWSSRRIVQSATRCAPHDLADRDPPARARRRVVDRIAGKSAEVPAGRGGALPACSLGQGHGCRHAHPRHGFRGGPAYALHRFDARLPAQAPPGRRIRLADGGRQTREFPSLEKLAWHLRNDADRGDRQTRMAPQGPRFSAARTFAASRRPEAEASLLPAADAPAWVFISGPLSELSSTALRRQAKSKQA